MEERRFWNEKIETLSREELVELQLRKLKKQMKYCYDNSEFYRNKFKSAGVEPKDIHTLEEFRKLPFFLSKEEERRSQEESRERYGHPFGMHLCCPVESVLGVAATSGTTGLPTFYVFTRNDMAIFNETVARTYWRVGIRPGDTVLHAYGLSMWLAGIPLVRACDSMGLKVIAVGAEAGSQRLLQFADLTKPKALLCTPGYAEHLIGKAPEILGKGVGELGIKILVCGGEPGAGLPEVRKRLEENYRAKIYDDGGMYGWHGISCDAEEFQGQHLVGEDYNIFHLDLVDPATGTPLEIKDGVIGECVVTALGWEASPPLRYKWGDILQVFTKDCVCGLPGHRIKYLGRADDLLIVKGVNVYPPAVKNVLEGFIPRVTGEMRIVLDKPGVRVEPPLKMKVEYGVEIRPEQLEDLKKELENKFSDVLRFSPNIELLPPNTLEKDPTKKVKLIEKRYERV